MITRGIIIGKIVDDLANLKLQIEMRNKLQIFDLTKVCEDFFKEVLNIVYKLNLSNLNSVRSNNPGIDLGDLKRKIAYQITSQKYSPKINETLEKITEEQLENYNKFLVFIIGEKSNSYKTVRSNLLKKCSFYIDKNIVDLDDLLKDIMVAEIDILDALYSLFRREFRQIKIELEPIDENGDYESSLYHNIEKIPIKSPKNAEKLSELMGNEILFSSEINIDTIINLYNKLSKVPRITRELIPIIAERGDCKTFNKSDSEYGILPQTLRHITRYSQQEIDNELNILENSKIIYIGNDLIGENLCDYVVLDGLLLNEIISWCIKEKINLKTLFNTMDWSVFDS